MVNYKAIRGYVKGLLPRLFIAETLFFAGIDVGSNEYDLLKAGEHRFQIQRYSQPTSVADQAIRKGRIRLGIYNINFSGDRTHYDKGELEKYLNTTFKRLRIKVEVDYQNVYPDDNKNNSGVQFFKDFIQNNSVDVIKSGEIKTYEKREERGDAVITTQQYFIARNAREALTGFLHRIVPGFSEEKDDILLILGDFKDSDARGASHSSQFIAVDKKTEPDKDKSGQRFSQNEFNATIAHETGHQLGLNHSSFWPLDVMSYAPISRWTIERFPQLAIGPESWFEWRDIKGRYSREEEPKIKQSQASAMQFVGNSRDFQFYRKHGFPRTKRR